MPGAVQALPPWLAWLQAFGVIAIAAAGAFIAYQQMRTAKTKLSFDLYDRRYKLYEAIRIFLSSVLSSGIVDNKELYEFGKGTREAIFLFDNIMDMYIKEIWKISCILQSLESEIKIESNYDERVRLLGVQGRHKNWLFEQGNLLEEKFMPFLKLDHSYRNKFPNNAKSIIRKLILFSEKFHALIRKSWNAFYRGPV